MDSFHKSSSSVPILNLCKVNHRQLKASVSLCLLSTTVRSPTMGSLFSSSSLSSSSHTNHHHHYDHNYHHYHHHPHHPHLLLIIIITPLTGPETDPGVSGPPIKGLKEVTESATPNPLFYPNSYLAELQSDPLSLFFITRAWLDSLPPVINNCPNSETWAS